MSFGLSWLTYVCVPGESLKISRRFLSNIRGPLIWPLVEAFQKEITMLPLVVVLTIIAIKDGLEDYRKYKIDKQINNLVTKVYSR